MDPCIVLIYRTDGRTLSIVGIIRLWHKNIVIVQCVCALKTAHKIEPHLLVRK